jgi:hypothetical protein
MVTLKGSQIALKYCLTTETQRTQRKTYLLTNREMPIGQKRYPPPAENLNRQLEFKVYIVL